MAPGYVTEAPGGGASGRGRPGTAVAFFDLDRTLIAGSSAFEFGRAAYKAGMLSRRQLARDAWENILFRLKGSTDARTDALKARMAEALAGVRVRDMQRLAPAVLAGVLPRLYPQMLQIAYEHQDAGRPIIICTAAAQEMAELMAVVMSFDGAIGSVSEVADGAYTGREGGHFTYREGKAAAMRDFALAEDVDLAASYAYTDSESDEPMLRLVGHPVAVNPDTELARIAMAEGWDILRFDQLGRRLRIMTGATAALVAGGAATAVRLQRAATPPPKSGLRSISRQRR